MPLLVQSIVVIGMWTSGVPNTRSAAIELHQTLNAAIYQQRDKWDASTVVNVSSACEWPIPMYQAILLHIIFALLSKVNGSSTLDLDLKPTLKSADAELLASLVKSCRKLGVFQYKNILARFKPDDLDSYVWVTVEEIKRFNLALFKVCRRLSSERQHTNTHAGGDDPGTGGAPLAVTPTSWLLTAPELEFPMQTNDSLWLATDKEEWTAAVDNVEAVDLTNMMESKWISKSADILQLT
ncbi:hypothetical protein BJY01DRAFT_224824 [Aspergillus pseudoustus]|uniref:Uncharacterized protein n=1 Tax=Aspergillus pseudoustus TaxID=1810923 RepID=A0ABR4J1M8_9EURO